MTRIAEPNHFDVAVIGGGLVGAAIAWGLRTFGPRVVVLDEGDIAHRAARGNFGLIWVQGKGAGLPAYGGWTQLSARRWPELAARLAEEVSVDVALVQPGGIHPCLTQRELDARVAALERLLSQPGFERYEIEVLDRAALARRLPGVGGDVVGGTYCAQDGHCNPLRLLRALHAALRRAGCAYRPNHGVKQITPRDGSFDIATQSGTIAAEKIVLAAGLGNATLAPMAGLSAPVRPQKGQIIVLERVKPFLRLPLATIRQTDEGTVLIGDSQEEKGFDDTLGLPVMAVMAARALTVFPFLRDVRVNRTWAALRVMSPDGFPVYAQSASYPGAFVASCHSGVTLAAAHAFAFAPAVAAGALPEIFNPFSAQRFDVQEAA
jgi:glycine/D-amino acid oxidase-like deaminating enzyme